MACTIDTAKTTNASAALNRLIKDFVSATLCYTSTNLVKEEPLLAVTFLVLVVIVGVQRASNAVTVADEMVSRALLADFIDQPEAKHSQ